LFYLQARGIREADARHMLMEAFVADVIETAELGETIGAYLRQQVRGWFERAEAAS
jgi:Fe-S cluster assembly scaffold protein SufB